MLRKVAIAVAGMVLVSNAFAIDIQSFVLGYKLGFRDGKEKLISTLPSKNYCQYLPAPAREGLIFVKTDTPPLRELKKQLVKKILSLSGWWVYVKEETAPEGYIGLAEYFAMKQGALPFRLGDYAVLGIFPTYADAESFKNSLQTALSNFDLNIPIAIEKITPETKNINILKWIQP